MIFYILYCTYKTRLLHKNALLFYTVFCNITLFNNTVYTVLHLGADFSLNILTYDNLHGQCEWYLSVTIL